MQRPNLRLEFIGLACLLVVAIPSRAVQAQQPAAAQVTFVNQTAGTVTINWVNFQNQEQNYSTLAAGQSIVQPTFIGHRWSVRDAQNQLLQVVAVNQVAQQAPIGQAAAVSPPPPPPVNQTNLSKLTVSNATGAQIQLAVQAPGQVITTRQLIEANQTVGATLPIGTLVVATNPATGQELARRTLAGATEQLNVGAAPTPPVVPQPPTLPPSTPVIPPNPVSPTGPAPLFPVTVEASNSQAVTQLLAEVNKRRAAVGLAAITLDERISVLARDIVSKWTSGEVPNTSAAVRGERAVQRATSLRKMFGQGTVIEENFQPTGTPESVVSTWMTHRNERNRLLGDFSLAGIGIASNGQTINYGMIFVKPATATATPPVVTPPVVTPLVVTPPVVTPPVVTPPVVTPPVVTPPVTPPVVTPPVVTPPVVTPPVVTPPVIAPPTPSSLVGGKYTGMTREQLEAEVVKEINLRRQQAGLSPVVLDERVSKIARAYSDDVASSEARLNQVMSGPGPRGNDLEPAGHWNMIDRALAVRALFGDRSHFGENVMPTGSPESVVINWMNSDGHRANMLHTVPTLVGVGIGVRPGGGFLLYTAIFTKPQYPNGLVKAPLSEIERQQLVQDGITRMNAARTAKQLTSTFRFNATLAGVAQQWAADIARRRVSSGQSLGATSPNGQFDKSGYAWRDVGESAAVDVLAEDAVNSWAGQRPGAGDWVLRNSGTVEFGLGVARGDDGKVYWSVVFAVPQ